MWPDQNSDGSTNGFAIGISDGEATHPCRARPAHGATVGTVRAFTSDLLTDLQVVELVDQEAQRQAQHARHRHHRRLRRTREHHRKQYERLCVPAVADEPRG